MEKIFWKVKCCVKYVVLGVIFCLSGCAKYRAEPLEDFTASKALFSDEEASVSGENVDEVFSTST